MRRSLLLLTLLAAGCSTSREPETVHYAADRPIPPLKTISATGDFGLFFGDAEKPEIPIRVEADQDIGFQSATDDRVQAVAGPFKMNLPHDLKDAWWRRLNHRED